MQEILAGIGKIFLTISVAVAGIFGFGGAPLEENVGATIPIPVAVFQTSLQSSITSSATSMTLVSGTDKSGDSISGYICFNIDEGTALEEFVCGTASGTAVTGMLRGIDPIDGDLEVTALKKAHRRGASVKVTNYPSLGILSRILNGNETIPNPITYATGIGPVASSDLADKEYVISVVSGGSVSFEKVVVNGNAGETVAAGNLLYLDSADSEWKKADADTASSVENVVLGIAQGAGTDGNAITDGVLVRGVDANQSGLTPNSVYYASNTAGGISASAGTKEVTIGIATGGATLLFAPRFNQQITEDLQDALAGTGGTPSSSNKFVTATGLTTASIDAATQMTGILPIANGGTGNANNYIKSGATTRDLSTASSAQNIAHGIGATPRMVKITATFATSDAIAHANTVYTTAQSSNYVFYRVTSGSVAGATFTIPVTSGGNDQTGVVTVDATNIIITWTKTGSPTGTAYLVWEAYQ